MAESTMTLYKIALVREETLAEAAKKIKLNQQLFISK
jgi:dsRNA-specific ribonuclease